MTGAVIGFAPSNPTALPTVRRWICNPKLIPSVCWDNNRQAIRFAIRNLRCRPVGHRLWRHQPARHCICTSKIPLPTCCDTSQRAIKFSLANPRCRVPTCCDTNRRRRRLYTGKPDSSRATRIAEEKKNLRFGDFVVRRFSFVGVVVVVSVTGEKKLGAIYIAKEE